MLVLTACSFSETESARMIMEMFWTPAVPMPCSALPSNRTGQSGAAAQRALPMVKMLTAN